MSERIPIEKYEPLKLGPRNLLQVELIKIMVPDLDNSDQLVWINKYAEKVSDMIDDTRNIDIRDAILDKNDFKKAALLIKDILEKEVPEMEMKKAA